MGPVESLGTLNVGKGDRNVRVRMLQYSVEEIWRAISGFEDGGRVHKAKNTVNSRTRKGKEVNSPLELSESK